MLNLIQLSSLIDEHKDEIIRSIRTAQQAVDKTKNNLNWMDKNYQKMVDWLEQRQL